MYLKVYNFLHLVEGLKVQNAKYILKGYPKFISLDMMCTLHIHDMHSLNPDSFFFDPQDSLVC